MITQPVIETKKIKVEMHTPNLRIVGYCHLPIEAYRGRLTDLLNEMGTSFIPITEAEVYRRDSDKPFTKMECIMVGKNFIEAVLPIGEEAKSSSKE